MRMAPSPNTPAGDNAEIPCRLTFGHHLPEVPEPGHRLGKHLMAIALLATLTAHTLADIPRACSVCGTALLFGPERDFDVDGLDSPPKVFHHYGIHSHVEGYLVCVYEVETTGGSKNEMEIRSTVVERIRGTRKMGDRLAFKRVSDATTEKVSRASASMVGGLYYVFLRLCDDGHIQVDAQNPLALWPVFYSLWPGNRKKRRKSR